MRISNEKKMCNNTIKLVNNNLILTFMIYNQFRRIMGEAMKVLTIILAIMVSSTSFGTQGGNTNWHMEESYQDMEESYQDAVIAIFGQLSTSSDCEEFIKPVLSIISKVYQQMKEPAKPTPKMKKSAKPTPKMKKSAKPTPKMKKSAKSTPKMKKSAKSTPKMKKSAKSTTIGDSSRRELAKAVAKAILTDRKNNYGFDELELRYITRVRDHFIGHILKHFSTVDGTLPQNGIHTRLIYDNRSMNLEYIKNVVIPTILNEIIDKGRIVFDVTGNTMTIKMKEDSGIPVAQIANAVCGTIGGFKVEEVCQRKELDTDNIYFFFQLHLAPTCNDTARIFSQDGNDPPDGRYGSCFVDCRSQS